MIEAILKKQLTFEGVDNCSKFVALFSKLYNIELFKDGLDLILTKVAENDLTFEVKIIKGWDTNVGCYLTEQSKVYNKFMGVFTDKLRHKIIIRNLVINVMAHEMAHALEVESGLVLNEDFRTAIGYDMKGRKANNVALQSSIQRVMIDGIKSYPEHQFISELFARYFETLSISRNVDQYGDFQTDEVMDFFENSTKWVREIFNAKIKPKIDPKIAAHTADLIAKSAFSNERKFTEKVESFHKVNNSEGKKWSANTKSNANWQKSWGQFKELDNKSGD